MTKKIRSMRFKYYRAFVLILVIPIMSSNLIMSAAINKIMLRNATGHLNQLIEQVSDNLNGDIKRASLAIATLEDDQVIKELVNTWANTEDVKQRFLISRQLDRNLNYLFNFTNDVLSVVFFLENGEAYNYKNNLNTNALKVYEKEWYKNLINNRDHLTILNQTTSLLNSGYNDNFISLAIAPKTRTNNDIEVIYAVFKSNIPDIYYLNGPFHGKGDIYVVDENYKILMAKDKSKIGSELSTDNNMFLTERTVEKVSWKIVALVDKEYLTGDVKLINTYLYLIIVILILLFITFSTLYFVEILNPINKLMAKMGQVEKGDFTTSIVLYTNCEINKLGLAFNKMVYEINNLTNERDKKERERNKAELEVLQSQINPHFLANTLNAIRFMTIMAKVDNISIMVGALIKLLNASFGKNGKFIQIKDELENLESYIHIMKIRYANKFDISINVDSQLQELIVLRLILQPIVENSILHGVNDITEKGKIIINGFIRNNSVIFTIEDNGKGITEKQINKVMSENYDDEQSFRSIGIGNVNKRIQLNHGMSFGVTIDSEEGSYTRVSIRLPILDKKEE